MLSASHSFNNVSMVRSIVDAFFEMKKIEMKKTVHAEVDKTIEKMFDQLVEQVKQFLVSDDDENEQKHSLIDNNNNNKYVNDQARIFEQTTLPYSPVSFIDKCDISTYSTPIVTNTAAITSTTIQLQPRNLFVAKKTLPKQPFLKNSEIFMQQKTEKLQVSDSKNHSSSSITYMTDIDDDEKKLVIINSPLQNIGVNGDNENKFTPIQNNKKRRIACTSEGCDKTFTKHYNMRIHLRSHQGLKPYHCRWPGCTYASSDRSHTFRHIRQIHFKRSIKQGEENRIHHWDPKKYLYIDQDSLRLTTPLPLPSSTPVLDSILNKSNNSI